MASNASGGRGMPWRLIGWAIPMVLISIPLIARFPWTLADYVFAAVMFGIVGGLLELTVRASGSWAYGAGVAAAVGISFMLVWVNAAVGMIGSEDNGANLMFFVVILMAIAGALAAKFAAAGMARAMMVAGAAQLGIAVIAGLGRLGADEPPGFPGVLILIVVFAVPWFVSAWLFRRAADAEN